MIKKQGVTFVISFDAVAHCTFQFISFSSCFQYSPLTEYWYFYDLWVEEDILNVIGGKTFSKKGQIFFSDLSINSTILAAFLAPAVGNDPKWVLCHHASTHGWAVSFTADVMEKETPLQSSEMVRTCSEDTRIFPGTVISTFPALFFVL